MGDRGVGAGDQAKAGRRLRPQPSCTGTTMFTAWGAGQQGCRPRRRGDDVRGGDLGPRVRGAAHVGAETIPSNDGFTGVTVCSPCEQNSDPVERLHGARGVCDICRRPDVSGHGARGVCPILDRLDVCRHGGLARSDDGGDSARRQTAPAPNRPRSRTGVCGKAAG